MRINNMDKERISISEIHNIESIRFSDLGFSHTSNGKTSLYNELINDGNTLIKPMLTVVYDGAKVLVLSSDDKNFNYYVKKVREVYLEEKDKPIVGTFFTKNINIDEISKRILLSDTITQTSDLYNYYSNMESFNDKLISKDSEIKALLPLIEYIINANLNNIDESFKLDGNFNGYGPSGNYTFYGGVNGIYTPIPTMIKKHNNTYDITIGNLFGNFKPLKVTINFKKTSLDIISNIDYLNYQMLETFKYKNNSLYNIKEIYSKENCVSTEPVIITKMSDTPSISKLDESDTLDWFTLPWGASIGFKSTEEPIDDESKTEYKKVQYISEFENTFINLESAEKRFVRTTKDFRRYKDIVFDDVDKTMVGLKKEDTIYIETSFNDDGATGIYKKDFANKYFYQFSKANSFSEISKENTYPVNKDYDVYNPGDLINNYKIKKKVKGN